jgi:hypothetical protein
MKTANPALALRAGNIRVVKPNRYLNLCLILQRSTARSAEVSMPDSKIYRDLPGLI